MRSSSPVAILAERDRLLVSICLGLLAEACAASIAYTPWSFVKRS